MGNMKELKEMKEKVRKNNKGFSLVELIIVIAIMAILVGIIGSQLVPYLERSREAKDRATLDTIYTAYQAALAENGITVEQSITGIAGFSAAGAPAGSDKTVATLKKLLGAGMETDPLIEGKFDSNAAGDAPVKFTFTPSTGVIQVEKGTIKVNNQ
ncbi:MAG TPA: prepilin-type N-terminal cleavage/methylation domain-containing protein [Lachnospiraceae bacterium]|nr:prepilin-type N-terminal cleavage/methylation domain-containing protein [Lachnospiraceae bacterium]